MAMLLKEVPELHATINLVPSLLVAVVGLHRGGPPGHASAGLAAAGRRPERGRRRLPARQLLHGPSGPDDPALSRATTSCTRSGACRVDPAERARQAVQQEGHHRPAMLVEPGVDPPAGLRARRRAGRVPRQGPRLDARTKSSGCWTSRWSCSGRSCRCTASWPKRGQIELTTTPFYHPILPLAVGQAAGPPGDARREAAQASRRLSAKTPRSRSAAPSTTTRSCSARSRAACGPRKARSARASSPPSPKPASNGSPPTRRSSPAPPTAGSPATATASSATRRCSTAPGAWKSRASSCRSSSATTP